MFYVLDVSGKHFQEVLVPQVQYMTDFRSGERMVYYSNVYGLMVYQYMIKRLVLTGNGRLWMDGVITKAPLGGKRYRLKSHGQI
jgi:hypothetical protein